jgi:hypothetical protein
VRSVAVRKLRIIPALLSFAYAGCQDGPSGTPVATTIQANSAAEITQVAGTAVSPPPSVLVLDQAGSPFVGAPVVFSVLSGGGTITGESITTDASGIATVGGWTLGKSAGPNVLNATTAGVSVTFNANGTAGPIALLSISNGDNQIAVTGTTVPVPPAVFVQDANGNGIPGVTVAFAVSEGGGSVTGASAMSNAAGIATVGSWRLGSATGTNALVASAAGAPSVTFHADATTAGCAVRTAHTLGGSNNGSLVANDCQFPDGSFVDFFTTTLPQSNAYLFRQTGNFDTYLDLAFPDGTVIAENDDATDNRHSAIKALLPAGTYLIGASSLEPGTTGSYSISSQVTSTDNANCEIEFVVRNVSTTQNLASDCLAAESTPASPIYADVFYILLRAGQSITVDMSSSNLDSYLELVRISGASVAQNDNRNASTKDAEITFTASVTDYYAIVARTAISSQSGAYTLSIQ